MGVPATKAMKEPPIAQTALVRVMITSHAQGVEMATRFRRPDIGAAPFVMANGESNMAEHKLKTLDRYWDAVLAGTKTFEVRLNDRAFQTGDILVLQKTNGSGGYEFDGYTPSAKPKEIRKRITYLLQGGQFGIEPRYCVLGLGDE